MQSDQATLQPCTIAKFKVLVLDQSSYWSYCTELDLTVKHVPIINR